MPNRQEKPGEQPAEVQVETSTYEGKETADTTDVLEVVPMVEYLFLYKNKEK